jgi:16S rRNA (adenine1518-N6/adenine1519-N6)-dimethyltransferase
VSLAELRARLEHHGLRLRRELGQNFLINPAEAERLVALVGIAPEDAVLEVGTGLGCLTRAIAAHASRVVTVEIDSGLARALEGDALLPENVELIHADILKLDLGRLIDSLSSDGRRVRVVANLPYSVASPLLRRLLDHREQLVDWTIMLQKEVAQRLYADVGSKDYGSLSVLHQLTTTGETCATLGGSVFFPAPRIESIFIRIRPVEVDPLAPGELRKVERVVRAAFGKRRKTLFNALRGGGFSEGEFDLERTLERVGIAPGIRAERVEPLQFLALARALEETCAATGRGGEDGAD